MSELNDRVTKILALDHKIKSLAYSNTKDEEIADRVATKSFPEMVSIIKDQQSRIDELEKINKREDESVSEKLKKILVGVDRVMEQKAKLVETLKFNENKLWILDKAKDEISARYMVDVKKALKATQSTLKDLGIESIEGK